MDLHDRVLVLARVAVTMAARDGHHGVLNESCACAAGQELSEVREKGMDVFWELSLP
jgi:hypothetical protein